MPKEWFEKPFEDLFQFEPRRTIVPRRVPIRAHDQFGVPLIVPRHPIGQGVDLRYATSRRNWYERPQEVEVYDPKTDTHYIEYEYPNYPPPRARVLPVGYSDRPRPTSDGHIRQGKFAHSYQPLTGYAYCGQWDAEFFVDALQTRSKDAPAPKTPDTNNSTRRPSQSTRVSRRKTSDQHHHRGRNRENDDFVEQLTNEALRTAALSVASSGPHGGARSAIVFQSREMDGESISRLSRKAQSVKVAGHRKLRARNAS